MPQLATLPPPMLAALLAQRRAIHARSLQGVAPDPVRIPYRWLSPPLNWAPDRLYTAAVVTDDGTVGRFAADKAVIDEYGESTFTATLATTSTADPVVLAHFTVVFYAPAVAATPRQRATAMALMFGARTPGEQALILSVGVGTRISVTGTPPDWPQGATEQVIEGVSHAMGASERAVGWITAPVVGVEAGAAGPWFRLGISEVGFGGDYVAY